MNTAIIIACVSTFPAFFNKIRSANYDFLTTVRLYLDSWWSAISLTMTSSVHNHAGKKGSKTDDSWHGDRTKLSDDEPHVSRNEVTGDEVELHSRTHSQNRESVDVERSRMNQQGIVRTVNFGFEYSGSENR